LFRKGQPANEMYLTVTGKFLVSEIGVELPPGRLMGELGFVTPNNRRTQTVKCIEEGDVLAISYDRLLEIYFENPEFGYYFLRLASDRLLQNNARLEGVIAAAAEAAKREVSPAPVQQPAAAPDPEQDAAIRASDLASAAALKALAELRRADAVKVVESFTFWSGIAGLVPVPLLDLAAVGGVQIQMVRSISKIYDVPFSENKGKTLIVSLAGSMIPASSGLGAASVTKSVPIVGTAIGTVAMPALSAGATYAIGMAFIQHFAIGGTLLDFNPAQYRDFVKIQKALWSARSRKVANAAKGAAASRSLAARRSGRKFRGAFRNWRDYLPH
jgi:uncharacterized protein (DUF697 family)